MTRVMPPALLLAALAAGPPPTGAADTTADWLKKILDPSTIGVTPFAGSTLNRKITVDTIRYDRDAPAAKRTAVYMVPLAQLEDAAKHFEKTLGTKARSDTDPQGYRRYLFEVTGGDGQPPKARGLRVMIFRSPWVDGMAQVQMDYLPPG
jgi:hypothetical protein